MFLNVCVASLVFLSKPVLLVSANLALFTRKQQAGYSSVGRASDCRMLQQSDGPWFDALFNQLKQLAEAIHKLTTSALAQYTTTSKYCAATFKHKDLTGRMKQLQ